MNKAETKAQQIFGKAFGNQQIITSRANGADFDKYKAALKSQQKLIKSVLRRTGYTYLKITKPE